MNMKLWLNRSKHLIVLVLLAGVILIPEAESVAVLYSIGVVLALVAISQIVRMLAFRYIDLQEYVEKAKEDPMASSIVFASVVAYTIAILFAVTMMLS